MSKEIKIENKPEKTGQDILREYKEDCKDQRIKAVHKKFSRNVLTPEEEEVLKEKFVQDKTDEIMKGVEDLSKDYVPGEDKTDVKEAWNEEVRKAKEAMGCIKEVLADYKHNMDKLGTDTLEKLGIIDKASIKKNKEPYVKPEYKVLDLKELCKPGTEDKAMTFDRICHEIMELHARKNKDYGNAADASYREFGIVSYVIRLNDKLNRLKSLTKPGMTIEVKDESIIDTLKDLAAYSIMAIESLLNE